MILVAVVWAFYRRYIEKLVRLKRGWKSGLVLIFIGGLMISKLIGKRNGDHLAWINHLVALNRLLQELLQSLASYHLQWQAACSLCSGGCIYYSY